MEDEKRRLKRIKVKHIDVDEMEEILLHRIDDWATYITYDVRQDILRAMIKHTMLVAKKISQQHEDELNQHEKERRKQVQAIQKNLDKAQKRLNELEQSVWEKVKGLLRTKLSKQERSK